MFRAESRENWTQLLLDLRPSEWVQQELDLEFPSQYAEIEFEVNNELIASYNRLMEDVLSGSTLHINTSGLPPQSRLTISPELVIDMPRKPPNALVRFFHKHLLNFTWEKL